MSAGSAAVNKIGNIASNCFSYGIQILVFGPMVIAVLAKFFPRVGMLFDSWFQDEPEPNHRYSGYGNHGL